MNLELPVSGNAASRSGDWLAEGVTGSASPPRPGPRVPPRPARCPRRPCFPRGGSLMTCRGSAGCSAESSAATPGLSEPERGRGELRCSRPAGCAGQWAASLYEHESEVRYLAWHAQEILVAVALARDDQAQAKIHAERLLAAAEPLRNRRARAVAHLGLARAMLVEDAITGPNPSPTAFSISFLEPVRLVRRRVGRPSGTERARQRRRLTGRQQHRPRVLTSCSVPSRSHHMTGSAGCIGTARRMRGCLTARWLAEETACGAGVRDPHGGYCRDVG